MDSFSFKVIRTFIFDSVDKSLCAGKSIDTLLDLLRESNPALYEQVQLEWRLYAECVGLVDTGYFKRSSDDTQGRVDSEAGPLARSHDGDEGLAADDLLERVLQSWMDATSDRWETTFRTMC